MSRNKVVSLQELEKIVRRAKRAKKTVVWTNGCFDLLHVGHVRYLEKARALGDILVVGLNSNSSTRKLKGAGRPLNRQADRAEVLAALESVDYITIFGATSPARLLERLKPSIFVKGADYSVTTMNQKERAAVEQGGGDFAFIKFVKGSSTTNLIEKIREM